MNDTKVPLERLFNEYWIGGQTSNYGPKLAMIIDNYQSEGFLFMLHLARFLLLASPRKIHFLVGASSPLSIHDIELFLKEYENRISFNDVENINNTAIIIGLYYNKTDILSMLGCDSFLLESVLQQSKNGYKLLLSQSHLVITISPLSSGFSSTIDGKVSLFGVIHRFLYKREFYLNQQTKIITKRPQ